VKNDQSDSQYLVSLVCWRKKAEKQIKDMEEDIKKTLKDNTVFNKVEKNKGIFSKFLKFFNIGA
jgi:hypothetical protein